jgi:antitoxin component of MazEF toxin-antitoxin module
VCNLTTRCDYNKGGVKVNIKIVDIGNSKGIRIPKPILTQLHILFDDNIDIDMENWEW